MFLAASACYRVISSCSSVCLWLTLESILSQMKIATSAMPSNQIASHSWALSHVQIIMIMCHMFGTLFYSSCYKFGMPKTIEQWLLFKYIDGEFTPLSKPLKTKQLTEKARSKYPERERKTIEVGV
jgi:hypothetical protein